MPLSRLIKTINLENTDAIAHNETLDHPAFIKKITGIDPFERPQDAMLAVVRALDMDWMYGIPKGSNKFEKGESKRKTATGYVTEWGFTGSGWSEGKAYTEEEVLAFEPMLEFGGKEAMIKRKKAEIAYVLSDQALAGEDFGVSGLYYTTLFQWFILIFGWDMFLVCAAAYPDEFEFVLNRFAEISELYAHVYAESDLPFFFCHDDLAITRGLVFRPEWYRKYIFPAYERIFAPFKKTGKKIIFVSDGNYIELVDDLFAAGADGIMVDWTFDLNYLLKTYGKNKIIIGNADTCVLTLGSRQDVKKEAMRCLDAGRDCPGYIIKCSNDLPHNIPLDNMLEYFDVIYNNKNR